MIRNYQEAFAILGLPIGASFEDCKKAYRNAVKAYHPDNNDSNVSSLYYSYSEAYQYLEYLHSSNTWPVMSAQSAGISQRRNGGARIIGNPPPAKNDSEKIKNSMKLYRENKLKKQSDIAKRQEAELKNKAERERREKEAQELLDEIKWMRIAGIIHDTIASDNKEREIDDKLKKAFAQHDKNIMNDKYRKSDDI